MRLPKCGYFGLNKIVSDSRRLNLYGDRHLEIFVDVATRCAWSKFQVSSNSCTEYHDDDIVRVGTIWCDTSRAHLVDKINDALEQRRIYGC